MHKAELSGNLQVAGAISSFVSEWSLDSLVVLVLEGYLLEIPFLYYSFQRVQVYQEYLSHLTVQSVEG